jgi:acetyltransferase-like isoleucine patch superfamily enzyme
MTTVIAFKSMLATAMSPLLRAGGQLDGRWGRFWSFARLRAQVGKLDPSIVVLGMPELHGTRRIDFGSGLHLYRDLHLETQEHGVIRIGSGAVLSRGVHVVAFHGIDIGEGTIVGEYASLRDANHRFGPGIAPRHSGHQGKAIHVGRNVWIGRGVTVLPGVTIGDGAVIGANAVVTHDVPPDAVVAGIPARPIRAGGR